MSEAPQIGGYAVLRLIGHGGAGRVFAARDEALGRTVAIKVLHPHVASDPKNVERFLREARAMATISSPHVASIYQVGQHQKVPFIVMEYLEGQNLEQRLQRDARVPVAEALRYARDCALALKAADAAGLVHRDVKPANILVIDGRAKLTDFGTARPVDGSADMTMEGQIAGTAAFMAPERVTGEGDDRRADIYSLGATLYCLISGEPPFVRKSAVDVIAAHLREEPTPLEQKVPGVSPLVGALVKRMMAKDPRGRFQSYDELGKALEGLLRGAEGTALHGSFDEQTEDLPGASATLRSGQSYAEADPNDPFASPPGTGAMVGEPTGVMGTLKQMSIVDICHMLEMGKKDAEIELTAVEGTSGQLCFIGGQVVYCAWDDVVAEEAFYRLARRKEGFFRIHYERRTTKKNIEVPTAFLMLEAMRRLDEQEHERGAGPDGLDQRHGAVEHDDEQLGATTDGAAAGGAFTTLPMGSPPSFLSGELDPLSVDDTLASPPGRRQAPPSPFGPPPASATSPGAPRPAMHAPRPAMHAPRRTASAPRARPATRPGLSLPPVSPAPSTPTRSSSSAAREAAASATAPTLLRDDTLVLSPLDESDFQDGPAARLVEKAKGLYRLLWRESVGPALTGANTQLADVTVRAFERSSALTPLARQLRARPWLPLAALCAGCFAVAFAVVLLLSLSSPSDLNLARIEGGEAHAVLEELDEVPPLERTAKQELLRASALARLDNIPEALTAYGAAAKLGLVDERGLALALAELGEPSPAAAMELLVVYPREEATAALLERVRDESWQTRRNALRVLEERGAKARVDLEALAIQDLLTSPRCTQRRLGLLELREHGKSAKAREAFEKAYALRQGENACMRADLDAMAPR